MMRTNQGIEKEEERYEGLRRRFPKIFITEKQLETSRPKRCREENIKNRQKE